MPGQLILSIDATTTPACLQVSEVEGRSVRVVERVEADLHRMFDIHTLQSAALQSGALQSGAESSDSEESVRHAHDSSTSDGGPHDSTSASMVSPASGNQSPSNSGQSSSMQSSSMQSSSMQSSSTQAPSIQSLSNQLREALSRLTSSYTSSILIIPTTEYLSFNLDLPFSDSRQIQKILELEVQDRVPFDTSEFLLEHRSLNGLGAPARPQGHDVHVSIVPKKLLAGVLKVCRAASFEPLIITTASSILEGLFVLAPEYFKDDSAVILIRPPSVYVALRVHGRVRVDRIFSTEDLHTNGSDHLRSLSTELRLTLVATEARYGNKIDQVYVIGDGSTLSDSAPNIRELQQFLGRPVELIDVAELVHAPSGQSAIGALGAPFAQDDAPAQILTNFRTREFSYSLQLSELLLGLRRLGPVFLLAMFSLFVFLAGSYVFRQMKIDHMESEVRAAIAQVLKDVDVRPGEEVATIQAENAKLDKALESLGSGSLDQYTALDVLREISAVMPPNPAITIRNIVIRGNRVKLSGSAPEYKDVEAIERALQRNRGLKFRAKPPEITAGVGSIPGGARSSQNFTFDIRVEE